MGLSNDVNTNDQVLKLFASASDYETQRATLRESVQECLEALRNRTILRREALPNLAQDRLEQPSLTCVQEDFQSSAIPVRPSSVIEYFRWLAQTIVPASVDIMSPVSLAHMTSILPNFAGILGELIVTLNQNLVKKDASLALTLLERQVLAMVHRLVYRSPEEFYDRHIQNCESTLGLVTQGGTLSNLTALWLARNRAFPADDDFPGVESAGLKAGLTRYGFDDAVILGSRLMHYSIPKAAGILGLGSQNIIRLPVDRDNRLDVGALHECLSQCFRGRQKVLAIVGIAGTTDCGSIDPLSEIAAIARDSKTFFHVDAAWGGPMLFSTRYAGYLDGIAEADSVVIDGHKQMYVPVGSSTLLFKDPSAAKVIEKRANYILQNGSGDLGHRSIEGSRAGSVLFLHAALELIGKEGYEFLIEENLRKAQMMADLIRESSQFELLLSPETNIVLYRYIPRRLRLFGKQRMNTDENIQVNVFNEMLQKAQSEAGRSIVSRTIIENTGQGERLPIVALRAVISNPLITEADLRFVLNDQAAIAAEIDTLESAPQPALAEWLAV
jgi:glutamate decarboxylase